MTSFNTAYEKNLALNGAQEFAAVYSLRGGCVRKTFAEFDRDVERVACQMAKLQVDQVVTIGGNSYPHLVYIAAAWRTGLPHCPLNPAETPARRRAKVDSLGGISAVFEEAQLNLCAEVPPHRERRTPKFMELIFTSGSTGYAKIVEQTEASILANAEDLIALHRLRPGEVVATSLPIFHINALHFAFLTTLLSGAKLVLLENFVLPQALDVLRTERTTILSAIPQILRALIQNELPLNLPDLRYVVSAAAPLSGELVRRFHDLFNVRIRQGYGLSEAVNFSCLMPEGLDTDDYGRLFLNSRFPSIGCALDCNEVGILRPSGELVEAPDQEGELVLRGRNVMRGYRGGPRLDPSGAQWFRTGDLGYFEHGPGGRRFYFVSGRIKDVIKRSGLTVSLREIDDILAEFPDADAISVPFENDFTGEDVGLALVVKPDVDVEVLRSGLEAFLAARLPLHLRPVLGALVSGPLRTSSGKALRWDFVPVFAGYKERALGRGFRLTDCR